MRQIIGRFLPKGLQPIPAHRQPNSSRFTHLGPILSSPVIAAFPPLVASRAAARGHARDINPTFGCRTLFPAGHPQRNEGAPRQARRRTLKITQLPDSHGKTDATRSASQPLQSEAREILEAGDASTCRRTSNEVNAGVLHLQFGRYHISCDGSVEQRNPGVGAGGHLQPARSLQKLQPSV
jgi:hypothetical protein